MIKIAICDDEKECCESAENMLKLYLEDKAIVAQIDSFNIPSELVDAIEKGIVYDIYLLDIYMPGLTGMSIATELRSRDVKGPIVFLTSSKDHALEAWGVAATDYLLKPYKKERFYLGLDKAMQSIATHEGDSIVLKVNNEYHNILVSKIYYCESEDKYQRINFADDNLLVRITVAELNEKLQVFGCFYRCGRGHIINLNHISKVTANGVVFKNGAQLTLPRAVLASLRSAFFDHFN